MAEILQFPAIRAGKRYVVANISNVAAAPSRKTLISHDLTNMTMERYYELTFGESWSDLEAGVRARHPLLFAYLDSFEKSEPPKKWWRIWESH